MLKMGLLEFLAPNCWKGGQWGRTVQAYSEPRLAEMWSSIHRILSGSQSAQRKAEQVCRMLVRDDGFEYLRSNSLI